MNFPTDRKDEGTAKGEDRIVRTVSRGVVCGGARGKWHEVLRLAENEGTIWELRRFICSLKDNDRFDGVLHRNTLKVSHRIGIVGLGFYGPFKEETAFYNVSIVVEFHGRKTTVPRTEAILDFRNISAKRGQIFYIRFEKMIVLEPDYFYSIGFQLEGPNTCILDPGKMVFEHVEFLTNEERDSYGQQKLVFSFLRGSLQMPEIKYVVL